MKATGVYWKPVWNVLEGRFDLMPVNAEHIKALSGKKCDRRDASHLADLLQHGLLQGSFIPPVEIRQLRDLTRNRARTVQETTRIKNRIQKILEEANIKLASVASDVLGVSGRLILKGLVAGEQDATKVADLAVGLLRKKRDQLAQALSGKVNDHHRLMLRKLLGALKEREAEIADDEADIRQQMEPFCKAVRARCSYQASTSSPRGHW
jgi:transposase